MSERSKLRLIPLYRTLFLDVFLDPRARRIFIYAALIISVGAALYHWIEGWNRLDSIYFVTVTSTTIGYGDFAPQTNLGKLLTIFYSLNGIILLLMIFDVVWSERGWHNLIQPPAEVSSETS